MYEKSITHQSNKFVVQLSQRILQTWYYLSIFKHYLYAWTTPEFIYFQYIYFFMCFLFPNFNSIENNIRILIHRSLHLIID